MKNGGNPIASTSINNGKLQGQRPGPSAELWSLATKLLQGEVPGGFWPPCFWGAVGGMNFKRMGHGMVLCDVFC